MLQKIKETAQWIKAHTAAAPKTAIVLGTGLGRLAAEIEIIDAFPYNEIPNFPSRPWRGTADACCSDAWAARK